MTDIFKDLCFMIVEDQQDARSMMRNMLMQLGASQIFEAKDGREALSFLDEAADMVHIVLCDWNMPNMTGLDVLKQLRSVQSDLPFLMITGHTDMESVLEAKTSGVDAYIRKPFSSQQLEAKLRVVYQKNYAS